MNARSRSVAVMVLLVLGVSVALVNAQDGSLLRLLGLGNQNQNLEEVEDEFADPEDIMTWINLPRSAKLDEEVTLKIEIENGREEKPLRLSGIEIEETFLTGFTLVGISPEPRHQDRAFGYLSLEYPVDITAGETSTYEIKLRPTRTGIFIGDVDIHEGQRWLTRAAQIRVTD